MSKINAIIIETTLAAALLSVVPAKAQTAPPVMSGNEMTITGTITQVQADGLAGMSTNAGGGVSIGPFSLNGNYSAVAETLRTAVEAGVVEQNGGTMLNNRLALQGVITESVFRGATGVAAKVTQKP